MKSSEIRKNFLDYFSGKGHTIVPSSGLVPEADPTLLFTNAGMVQFKKVFLGEEKREYQRAASCQKCMRAGGKHNDLENVGRTARHHTFFEMLGNFSFGDYFKEGAIEYGWEFLTKVLGLPEERLWVTIFEEDNEAERIWRDRIGLRPERIKRMGEEDNFWSMGDVGPCGPCSEIIIDQGEGVGCGSPSCQVGCDCDRYLELWNLVFMQFNRDADGVITPLPSPSIDTGMGLERLTAVLQGKLSNYDTDLFAPIIERVEKMSGVEYGRDPEQDLSIRAISDHSRAVTFLISEGILPSNEGRGYVLRRIIRRAARHGRFLGITEPFLHRITGTVIELLGEAYPEIVRSGELVEKATKGEEERFFETLERGLAMLEEEMQSLKARKKTMIPGSFAFKLYDTYGFPLDLTADIVLREGFTVDEEGFNEQMNIQRLKARRAWKGAAEEAAGRDIYGDLAAEGVRSRFVGYHLEVTSSRVVRILKDGKAVQKAYAGDSVEIITEETPFYGESGGQVGDTGTIVGKEVSIEVVDTKKPMEEIIVHHCLVKEGTVSVGDTLEMAPDLEKRAATCRNHTATHLIHAALRKVLGEHVRQAGSLVTPSGLRFDFNHFAPLTDEELEAVEREVNSAIRKNLEVTTEVLAYQEAVEKGALAFFGEKYGETVRMVRIDEISSELCGGTHVTMTGDIGLIKILSESSVAAGVRRIEAVTGEAALQTLNESYRTLTECAGILKVSRTELPARIRRLMERQKELEKEVASLKESRKAESAKGLLDDVRKVDDVSILAVRADSEEPQELRKMADLLRSKLGSGIVVLASKYDGKALLLASVTRDLAGRFSAGEIIKRLAPIVGGRGGGRPEMAQAGGKLVDKIDEAIEEAYRIVKEMAEERHQPQ